jgi:uncharacterized membrane protein
MRALDRLKPERIEALTDLVFGLGLAISAVQLTLHPPVFPVDVLTNILEFAVSFAVLIWMWVAYSRIVANLRVESSRMLVLNGALLLAVGIEPYLLHILWLGVFQGAEEYVLDLSSIAYAIDLALMVGILGGMMRSISNDGTLPFSPDQRRWFHSFSTLRLVVAGLFAVTILPLFWNLSANVGETTNGAYPIFFRARYIAWVLLFLVLVVGPRLIPSPPEATSGAADSTVGSAKPA